MSVIRKVWAWLNARFREMWPFFVCVLAGLFLNTELGIAGAIIAGLGFAWALDLAAERAAARAKEETAGFFISHLTSGNDTELTITYRTETTHPSDTQQEREE